MVKMEAQLAMDLLDESWFFNNPLFPKGKGASLGCPNQEGEANSSSAYGDGNLAPLRMPTLPPRLERPDAAVKQEVPSLKGCNPKLRQSLSSLDRYRSDSSSKNSDGDRPPRYVKLERSERYLAIQHYIDKEAYYRKIFKEKKWRSSNDLEYIEVQGFKDLGFVFDKRSARWLVKRSAPPIFRYVDKRSTEDMKEQLKFWARAVACNARKES